MAKKPPHCPRARPRAASAPASLAHAARAAVQGLPRRRREVRRRTSYDRSRACPGSATGSRCASSSQAATAPLTLLPGAYRRCRRRRGPAHGDLLPGIAPALKRDAATIWLACRWHTSPATRAPTWRTRCRLGLRRSPAEPVRCRRGRCRVCDCRMSSTRPPRSRSPCRTGSTSGSKASRTPRATSPRSSSSSTRPSSRASRLTSVEAAYWVANGSQGASALGDAARRGEPAHRPGPAARIRC